MATRMQQRRGTAAQWTSANPILNAGEMGWESDTNKFKIGDGTNHWADIDYFIDQSSTVNPAFGSSITFEGATANNFETTLAVTDPTADRTLTLPDETGTIATTTYVDNATAQASIHDAAQAATVSNLSATYVAGSADSSNGTGVGATLTMDANGAFTVDGYSASSGDRILVKNQTTSTQNGIYTVTTVGSAGTAAVLTRATDYDNTPGGQVRKGDFVFTLNGTVNQNVGFMMTTSGTNADGSTRIGTDALTWTQISALGEVDAGNGITKSGNTLSVDTSVIQARVADISDTEIGYLNGVTSAIQTQLDAKAALAGPTFTGTVVLPGTTSIGDVSSTEIGYVNGVTSAIQTQLDAKQAVVTDVSNTEIGYLNGVTSAIQTQLDAKVSANDATLTGTVSLPTTTSVGDVSSTELQYVNGVTSGIQGQLDAKAGTAHTHLLSAGATDVTASAAEVNKLAGLATTATELGYVTGVTSAIQTQLNNKAVSAGPTFTGTVVLPSTTSIGDVSSTEIEYVNGVTSAIQTQLDAKAPLANPTFTGTVSAAALTLSGDLTVNGTTTTINSTTLAVDDKNIVIGDVATPSDATADGGGITLKGATDKTFNWVDATDSWTSSEHIDLASGKNLKVNGTAVISSTAGGFIFTDGTQTLQGVPSITPRVEAVDSYNLSTGGLTLRDNVIEISKATGVTLTIPTNATTAFPVGTSIDVIQVGAGQITIAGAAGVTVNATPGLKLRAQWSSATLFKRATDTWIVMGDLSA